MKYNLSKTTPPAMPRLGKGTESVALLLSQVSKDTQKPIVSMLFPILGAHVSGAEFMYPDLLWKETSGMMANLVADSGAGKGHCCNFAHVRLIASTHRFLSNQPTACHMPPIASSQVRPAHLIAHMGTRTHASIFPIDPIQFLFKCG